VASLNLDYFDLPGGKIPQSVKGPEVVDLDSEPEDQPPVEEAPKVEALVAQVDVIPGPGLPPPELVARMMSGDLLPVPPASPLPFPWSPPPSPLPPPSPVAEQLGAGAQPCMLSAEQFFMWQQSLQNQSYSDYSSSEDDRERRKKKKKEKKQKDKKEKKKQQNTLASPFDSVEPQGKAHRKSKRRRREQPAGVFQ